MAKGTIAGRLTIQRFHKLTGANQLADGTVVVAVLSGPVGNQRWPAALAMLDRLLTGVATPVPPAERPSTVGSAVEGLATALLVWCGHRPAARRRARPPEATGGLAILAPASDEITEEAIRLAVELLAVPEGGADVAAREASLRSRLLALRDTGHGWLRGSRKWLVRAAEARGIPWRLVEGAPHLLLFGEGRNGRRFHGTASWKTTHVSGSIAVDKGTANRVLRYAGVPAARQLVTKDAASARAAAAAIGFPLVFKPTASRLQRGVTFVYGPAEVDAAFAAAIAEPGSAVAIESYLPGREYRILMVDGDMIEAFERPPPQVVGDGVSTLAQLVEMENAGARRGSWREGFRMSRLALDAQSLAFLAHCGRSLDDVPGKGEVVAVHPMPMLRHGGPDRVPVTDRVHPDNLALLRRAMTIVDLDIGGIDFRTPDIARSWREVGAGICEINPQPDIDAHYMPGLSSDVGGVIIDRLVAGDTRMRHVLIVGAGLDAHAAAVAAALRASGRRVAVAEVGREVRIDLEEYPSLAACRTLPEAYGVVVEDPTLDAAVFVVSGEDATRWGFGAARLDVALLQRPPDAGFRAALAMASVTPAMLPSDPQATAVMVLAAL
ncbi:MAG: hypothetical protein AB7P02_08410 [Alphaproteobacteria bacterium]